MSESTELTITQVPSAPAQKVYTADDSPIVGKLYDMSEVRRQMIEAVGSDTVAWRLDDGTVLHFEHPLFRSGKTKKALRVYGKQDADDQDEDEFAKIVLGDDYEDFILHDGDPGDLQLTLLQIQRDTTDMLTGKKQKGRPTA
jgi:hypothetical protein